MWFVVCVFWLAALTKGGRACIPQNEPLFDMKLKSLFSTGLAATPVHTGQFSPGADTQEIHFARPASGRYFCLEALSAHDGKAFAAVAELELLDAAGQRLGHEGWTIAYVDSEEREKEDGSAENAIDGQVANFWHTQWGAAQPPYPHRLVLDLGQTCVVSGIRYVPRQGADTVTGRIK